ncbi:hypothetical protein ACFLWA_13240 [Chloroflexota bacterium]
MKRIVLVLIVIASLFGMTLVEVWADDLGEECSAGDEICKVVTFVDEDGDGTIEEGEKVTFDQWITVDNHSGEDWTDVKVKDNFGAELAVTFSAPSAGTVESHTKGNSQKVKMKWWEISDLGDGTGASLQITAETDLNPGGNQSYTECGVHEYNSGATLWVWDEEGKKQSFETEAILVEVYTENMEGDCDGDGVIDGDDACPFDAACQ